MIPSPDEPQRTPGMDEPKSLPGGDGADEAGGLTADDMAQPTSTTDTTGDRATGALGETHATDR